MRNKLSNYPYLSYVLSLLHSRSPLNVDKKCIWIEMKKIRCNLHRIPIPALSEWFEGNRNWFIFSTGWPVKMFRRKTVYSHSCPFRVFFETTTWKTKKTFWKHSVRELTYNRQNLLWLKFLWYNLRHL